MELTYSCVKLAELTAHSMLEIGLLRQKIFILEQRCLYPDLDDADFNAWHVLARDANEHLVAYLRILAPGVRYEEPSIGRLAVAEQHRRSGVGTRLLEEGMRLTAKHYPNLPIKLSAQTYTLSMYHNAGFVSMGKEYLEDDIPHQAMIYRGK